MSKEKQVFVPWSISENSQVLTDGRMPAFAPRKKGLIVVIASLEVVVFISGFANEEVDCLHRAGVCGQLAIRWNQSIPC